MDTYDLFRSNNTSNDVRTALEGRYGDASCEEFNVELSNVWNNFYKKKIDVIGSVETRTIAAQQRA